VLRRTFSHNRNAGAWSYFLSHRVRQEVSRLSAKQVEFPG
jgi:hypothetical protein